MFPGKVRNYGQAYSFLAAEFLFILLPFVVSAIVFTSSGRESRLLHSSEWSLAAAVLIGQSLVKFISGMLANQGSFKASWERVALAISFLIVFCLVPSLVVLSLVLVSDGPPTAGLIAWQISLFFVAVLVFFAFGASGEALMRLREPQQD